MSTSSQNHLAAAPATLRDILVIRGGAIGDFILTLPVLAALRRRYPDCHLVILGYPHIAQLARTGGLADEVYPFAARGLTAFFVRGGDLARESAAFFARFDLILSYVYDPDGIIHENLSRCSKARLILGPHRPNESLRHHATEAYLKPLEQLGILEADPVPRLRVAGSSHPTGQLEGGLRTIALHPGSGSDRKNWPEAKWGELISQLLHDTALDLLLMGGEAEGARLDRLTASRSSSRLWLAQNLPLVELARRLVDCVAFVGHDSGISHLAAALGLPGVVLWGDSVEAVWRPRSNRCILLRDPRGLAKISVIRVVEALAPLVEGSGLRQHNATVHDVISQAEPALPATASVAPSFDP